MSRETARLRPRTLPARSVGHRPAEVHLDVDAPLIPNRQEVSVPELTAVGVASFVSHEYAIGICDEMDEVEPVDALAVGPTTAEVRFPINTMS